MHLSNTTGVICCYNTHSLTAKMNEILELCWGSSVSVESHINNSLPLQFICQNCSLWLWFSVWPFSPFTQRIYSWTLTWSTCVDATRDLISRGLRRQANFFLQCLQWSYGSSKTKTAWKSVGFGLHGPFIGLIDGERACCNWASEGSSKNQCEGKISVRII